jgi:hypothetical protein
MYHMTVQPRSRAPIKNHTEKSRDWVCTGLVEQAVRSRPKGVRNCSVAVLFLCFFVFFPFVCSFFLRRLVAFFK